ncbi:hypothetical protein ACU42Y_15450 [Proteus mirabilis]
MRTFAINQHNDLVIDAKGDLQICDNDEAVKNLCQHFIKAVRGEMLHKKIKVFLIGQQHLAVKLIFLYLKWLFDNVWLKSRKLWLSAILMPF